MVPEMVYFFFPMNLQVSQDLLLCKVLVLENIIPEEKTEAVYIMIY